MIRRVKDVVTNIGSGTTPKSGEPKYYDNGNIPWLNSGDLNDGVVTATAKTITEDALHDFSALHYYPKNSVVVAMYGASIGNTGIIDFDTTVNQACCVLTPDKSKISSYFLQLLLQLSKPKFLLESFGGTQPNISQKIVANMLIDVPPLAEQEAIAAYLDKECEKIGREIELLERKADGYRRLRRSLINRAVTRGLNPNAYLKPSEIPYISQFPSHWALLRIKDLFSERVELSETGDEDLLSVSEYYGVAKRADKVDGENISRSDSLIGYKKCYINDIVSNIMLAWKGSLGKTEYDGIVSPAYGVYQPIAELDASYFHYLFRTELFKSIFRTNSRGIIESRLRLYTPNFLALKTFVPPINEQHEIVAYLDDKCGKIDAIVEKIDTKIELLKQLKRSLINEVVTGQRAINTSEL